MAMIAGDSGCTTGMAAVIYQAHLNAGAIDGPTVKALSFELATAIVGYIQANATVTISTVTACPAGAGTGSGVSGVA